jgi:uncharacterized damage-inducible protein DinB
MDDAALVTCPMCRAPHHRLGRRSPVAALAAAPAALTAAVRGAPRPRLTRRPAPGEWSVAEVLAHLLDVEIALGFRIRKAAAEPGAPIVPFDQDRWAEHLGYRRVDPRRALAAWTALRGETVALARRLSPAQRAATGMHPEYGPLRVEQILAHLAEHDLDHLGQVRTTLHAGAPRAARPRRS